MKLNKYIDIHESYQDNKNNSCSDKDTKEKINNLIDKFKLLHKHLIKNLNDTSDNGINSLLDKTKEQDNNLEKLKILWNNLEDIYNINIEKIIKNFDNIKNIENELNLIKKNEKNNKNIIEQLKIQQQSKDDIYLNELNKYNNLVKKTNAMRYFLYIITALFIVPILYTLNIIDKNTAIIILILGISAAVGYVIYELLN